MAELQSYKPKGEENGGFHDVGQVKPDDTHLDIGASKNNNAYADNGVTPMKAGKYQKDGDGSDSGKSDDKKKDEPKPMVGFFNLFRFATKLDVLFMIIGSICAACNGATYPLLMLVFGDMIDLFVNDDRFKIALETMGEYDVFNQLGITLAQITADRNILSQYKDQIFNLTESKVNIGDLNRALEDDLLDLMQTYGLYYIGIGVGSIVLGYLQVALWMLASERQTHQMRLAFYSNILRQDIGWFDTHESGELNTRLSNDISSVHDGIGDKLASSVQWLCGALIGVIIGFVYGWELTLVILAVSPLLAGAAFLVTKLVGLASSQELKAYATAGSVAEEVLGAVRTVVAFGGQEKECERYNRNLKNARDLGVRKGFFNGLTLGVTWLIVFAVYALGFWYGAKKTRDDPDVYTIGNVMIVFFSVVIAAFSLGNASPGIQSLAVARTAAYTIWELIDLIPPIDIYSREGIRLEQFKGSIELRGVHFRYPSRPDVQILKGVNLKISRGQTVALVGSSGCGKSTVVQLIQRFYDAERGQILIDGTDIKDINLKWLREHIGIVSQEPVLFGTTIAENIRYGRDGVSQQEIEAAAGMANAHDFIMKLPDKYNTLVGERGAQLSGGQKQRIAIARALVRNPQILLLDEATSALDTESEGVVQEALEKASHGRTTIVIAHRLSTIKTADMIAGFKDGVVAEQGTHDDLMNHGGIYHQLVTLQTKSTEDDLEAEMYDAPKTKLQAQKSLVDSPLKRALSVKEEEEEEKEKETKEKVNASLGRILKINAEEWWCIMLGCFASLLNGGTMPAFAIIFAEILGVFAEPDLEKQEEEIRNYVLLFVAIGVASLITYLTQGYMFGRSGEYLTLRLRAMSFKAMLRQEISYFDDHNNTVGALTTRLATDASQVQGASGVRLGSTIMALSSILIGVIIAFIYSWKLTLVILVFFPFIMVGGALQMKMLNGAAGKNKEALEAAGKVAVESIENIRTVASLTKEKNFYDKFVHELLEPYRISLRKAHVIGISFSITQGIIFFAYAAAFWYGATLVKDREIDYVAVFKVFSAIVFGAMSIGQASSFAPDAAKAQTSAEQIFKLLDSVPSIDAYSTEGEKPSEGSYTGSVTFADVKFRYPTRKDVTVLNGLNITVSPGQTVALVGSSGCGKSTTVQLIERFYDAEDGSVYLDRYKIPSLNLAWLRSQIGIVSQEPILFDRSIAENIAYGDNSREVSMNEIITAARKANIHEFISNLPDGYDTNVGEKGAQLSGGQKQRVAIARALVRNPKILLLDEATSALDTESEKIVQEALDKAREGRTSIVIAHRLSTIQNADKIYVIRHGVVTEEGTHSELMNLQGFYYKLNMAQARKK